MDTGMGRRLALLGTGLLLVRPARADDARMDAAIRALAGRDGTYGLDRDTVLLRPWHRGPRAGLWVAAAVAKGDADADGAAGDRLRAAVLQPEGAGFRVLASGGGGALADEPLWDATLGLDEGAWPMPGGKPLVGVTLGNSYNSTARSSATTALHLFRWDGPALRLVLAAMARTEGYDKNGEAGCLERSGYAPPGTEGRQAPPAVADRCNRLNSGTATWTVQRSDGSGLVVRDNRNRVVSRHRWTGAAYDPAEFRP